MPVVGQWLTMSCPRSAVGVGRWAFGGRADCQPEGHRPRRPIGASNLRSRRRSSGSRRDSPVSTTRTIAHGRTTPALASAWPGAVRCPQPWGGLHLRRPGVGDRSGPRRSSAPRRCGGCRTRCPRVRPTRTPPSLRGAPVRNLASTQGERPVHRLVTGAVRRPEVEVGATRAPQLLDLDEEDAVAEVRGVDHALLVAGCVGVVGILRVVEQRGPEDREGMGVASIDRRVRDLKRHAPVHPTGGRWQQAFGRCVRGVKGAVSRETGICIPQCPWPEVSSSSAAGFLMSDEAGTARDEQGATVGVRRPCGPSLIAHPRTVDSSPCADLCRHHAQPGGRRRGPR